MIPNVLSIAGSDPSGGAGIQADIKSISANGAYALAVITALTAQNTKGVTGVELINTDFIRQQINTIFDDIEIHAIKIGMLGTVDITECVADCLRGRGIPIILDPVMVAKSGDRLLSEDSVKAMRDLLLPISTIITPNLPEAADLLGIEVAQNREEMREQAQALLELGAQSVFLKGGHLKDAQSPDLLKTYDGENWLETARIDTKNTHGTGCTLSSAIAAQYARHGDMLMAVKIAKSYITGAIAHSDQLKVGGGHGPTHHFFKLIKE